MFCFSKLLLTQYHLLFILFLLRYFNFFYSTLCIYYLPNIISILKNTLSTLLYPLLIYSIICFGSTWQKHFLLFDFSVLLIYNSFLHIYILNLFLPLPYILFQNLQLFIQFDGKANILNRQNKRM